MRHVRFYRVLLLTVMAAVLMAQSPTEPAPAEPESTDAPASVGVPGPPAPGSALQALPGGSNIAILPVKDMIYGFTLKSLERRIDRAVAEGADLIIIEIDTNGGMVTAAIDICKLLKDRQRVTVPTVAWVHPKAYSAGIIIGSACDELVMSSGASTGASAPVSLMGDMEPTERAKAVSPILAEFRNNASRNDYDFAIFHAMTVLGVKLYMVEHKETGERRVVNQVDYGLMVNGQEPGSSFFDAIKRGGMSATDPARLLEVARETATDDDLSRWTPVEKMPSGQYYPDGMIHDGMSLFTVDEVLAQDIGLSQATLSTDAEVRQHFAGANLTRINQTWSEGLAGFLTHPITKAILVAMLLVGTYLEMQSPGFGLGGALALVALIALLVSPFVIGLSDVWFVLVFVLGLVLLAVELLFTPTFGVLGIVGVVLMIAGLIFSAVPTGGGTLPIPPREMWDRLLQSTLWTVLGLGGGIACVAVLMRYLGELPMFQRFILSDSQLAYTSETPAEPIAGDEVLGDGHIQLGDLGRVAASGLRPTGRADFGDVEVDVVSHGSWIEPGTKVKVVEVHGNRIVVDPAD